MFMYNQKNHRLRDNLAENLNFPHTKPEQNETIDNKNFLLPFKLSFYDPQTQFHTVFPPKRKLLLVSFSYLTISQRCLLTISLSLIFSFSN